MTRQDRILVAMLDLEDRVRQHGYKFGMELPVRVVAGEVNLSPARTLVTIAQLVSKELCTFERDGRLRMPDPMSYMVRASLTEDGRDRAQRLSSPMPRRR